MNLSILLVQREFRANPRRRFFYWKRTGLVMLGSVMLVWGGLKGAFSGATTAGFEIFRTLCTSVLFATCVLAALVSGYSIVREKIERTLGLLFLSDMTSSEHILGKYLAGMLLTLVMVMSIFPIFVLSATLGGVSILQIASAFIVLLGTISLGCSIGLYASSVASTERGMGIRAGVLSIGVFGILPALVKFSMHWVFVGNEVIMPIVSPFAAMSTISWGTFLASGPLNFLFSVLLGIPFMALAWWRLPKSVTVSEGATREGDLWQKAIVDRLRRWYPKPPILGNPICWRDLQCLYNGIRGEWILAGFIVLPIVGLCTFLLSILFDQTLDIKNALMLSFTIAAGAGGALFAIMVVYRSSRALFGEIENRTMDVLLTTPVTDKMVVNGKFKAVYDSTLPWLVLSLLCGTAAVIFSEEASALIILVVLAYLGFSAYAFACVALLLSLRFRATMVMVMTVLFYIVWNSFVKPIAMTLLLFVVGLISAGFAALSPEFGILIGVALFLGFLVSLDVTMAMVCLSLLKKKFRRTALSGP